MITGKTLLLAAVLAAAPFAATSANAQVQRNTMSTQTHDRMTATDRGTMSNHATPTDRDRMDMHDRDMRDHHMRDMRHHGWTRGHHYGWRHCTTRWHHHHRVRVCGRHG
jgi:Ni/Co efflux regulator RcnB